VITWVGDMHGTASFPTVNRNLTAALVRAGADVRINQHNVGDGPDITPICAAFEYPPRPVNVRHPLSLCFAIWEFGGGARAVPETFRRVFQTFDRVIVPNAFVQATFEHATETPIQVARYLGVNPEEFNPQVVPANWADLFPGETWMHDADRIILGVGGTDLRHGWDQALAALDQLPDGVHMVAKWDIHYPRIDYNIDHPRFHILHADLPSLAPLYRAADAVMLPARGVGFSLPALEALACGVPLASAALPPVREFATDYTVFAEGGSWHPAGIHHIHSDCLPDWWDTPLDSLIGALQQALTLPKRDAIDPEWIARWSWDGVAVELRPVLEGAA
jgi:glycosyltransferase involved in cell wall biosynthesis